MTPGHQVDFSPVLQSISFGRVFLELLAFLPFILPELAETFIESEPQRSSLQASSAEPRHDDEALQNAMTQPGWTERAG